nr:MAG TPA: Bifunctional 3'-phosphoadenosine 5'-phosphosulfate synthetase 1-kinase fold [Caudoviricetes sp.]DAX49396.1 MAG TPA: Bifunctional 3'-phosphoadenosine 5'-phosphosulfate synthetase 1-kinase fold [Caudoviricetes sp.]
MIIVGYPCIGKSTYAAGHPYRAIDLESSNFVKADNWVKSYCNVAIDLSRQGHVVFVSSHDAVRKQLLKSDYEYVFVIYPALDIKEAWLERLHERYLETKLTKDYLAWQRALNHYDEDIAKLKEDAKGFSGFYEIGRGRYDLTVILDEFDYGSTWDHS